MSTRSLVFGLLRNPNDFPDKVSADRARDLTIAWSRFKYFGEIFESDDIENLLDLAEQAGASHCLVQHWGQVLSEVWRPGDADTPELMQAIDELMQSGEALYGSNLPCGNETLENGCCLIQLAAYRQFQQGQGAIHAIPFPEAVAYCLVQLDPQNPAAWQPELNAIPESKNAFLESIDLLTHNLRRGIFVWNLESYDDVEIPSDRFTPPLKALYTVSAGFKPNRILHTHGFSSETRMVVFDYSEQGLAFRRMLHEEWDGDDYPSFLRRLFQEIPPSEAFYLLWDGMTPDKLDWSLVQVRWQQELDAWGGAELLHQHWQKFRALKVEYLHCNILTEHEQLLEQIKEQDNALVWWSNAFFSIYSNWLYSSAQRQSFYRHWIEKLAAKAPRILLYGSDCHNTSVNFYSAGEYQAWFSRAQESGFGDLKPPRLGRYAMRY